MAATVSLEQSELSVEPGGTVSTTVRVRNTGRVVDNFSVQVLGAAAAWCRSEPPSLNLFPGADGTVTVTAAPPRSPQVPAGACPFGLRVSSAEDPEGSVVEEGVFHVGRFYDVTAELVPHTSRGRRMGIHDLAIDNRSNVLFNADFVGSDPDSLLGFAFAPPVLSIAPGTAGFTRVRVRARRRFWRGAPLTRPFEVEVRNDQMPAELAEPATAVDPEAPTGPQPIVIPPPPAPGGPAPGGPTEPVGAPPTPFGPPPPAAPTLTVEGSMLQEALLPGWLPQAIAAVVVLALLLTLLWFTLFKPQIRSAAKDQVSHQLAAAGITTTTSTPSGTSSSKGHKPLSGSSPPATAPSGTPSPSGGAAGGGGGGASGGSNGTTTGTAAGASTGTAVDGRLAVTGNGTAAYTVPKGKVLQLTDVDFQNPAGNTGTVILARNSAVLFQMSMANFRDLDYHWISPIVFAAGDQMQLIATGCASACTPGLYYAGYLANG